MAQAEITAPDRQAVEQFRSRFHGELLLPEDGGYQAARGLWNGMIDKRPALIARCAGVADVLAAVNFAREQRLPVAVRGGGHNVAGGAMSQGGVTIDLSRMRAVRVDPAARTVRAEGGATWDDVDREAQAFGLVVPGGVVSDTGIAGLTLGGGLGWLRRKYGLSCDNLISVDIVTADGQFRTASETENADLFWALRGAGHNLGVVTSFEYHAHPLGPDVFFLAVMHSHDRIREVLRYFRQYTSTAPDEVGLLGAFATFPEGSEYPQELWGQRFFLMVGAYAGDPEEGEAVMRPLREFAPPVLDVSGVVPYVQAQKFFDEEYPTGRRYYWKSLYLRDLSDETIEALVRHAESYPSQLTTIDLWHVGGAIDRFKGDTAFPHRGVQYGLTFESNWEDPKDDKANISWTRAAWRDMQRFSTGGLYLNFPGFAEEGEAFERAAYGNNYERVLAVKKRYDPANLFR